MKNKIKFAVVGAGHIGKRHATMVQRNDDSELVAVVDIDSSKEQEVKELFDVPFFTSIEALFASDLEYDVVNVATPNDQHAPQSVLALEHGYHVVCEKPMALTKADCEQVIFKSLQANKLVFCVMQNRYSPPSIWLKETVESGILGEIYLVQINCFWNRDDRYYKKDSWKGKKKTDGGTLFTQFSHFVDLMYWLFGDVKNISAQLRDFNHKHLTEFEDSGIVSFDFTKGGLGSINYSTSVYDKNLESSMTIVAEKGSIKVGGQYMDKIEYCHIEDYEMPDLPPTNPANDYGAYKGSAANHHYIIENVVDTLNNGNVATTNAMEGLKVVEIIERIYSQEN